MRVIKKMPYNSVHYFLNINIQIIEIFIKFIKLLHAERVLYYCSDLSSIAVLVWSNSVDF